MSERPAPTVLYVDDDPDIRQIARAALGLVAGFTVHLADGGLAAIELARRIRPDVILLDVMMPGLDGPGTLSQMRADPSLAALPVILITAKVMPVEIEQFRHLGVAGVIAKPFDPLTLGAEVRARWNDAAAAQVGPAGAGADADRQVKAHEDEIAGRFLRRTRRDALRVLKMLERVQRGDKQVLVAMEHLAHSIHGGGATFGFRGVSAIGGAIEQMIVGLRANPASAGSPPDPNIAGLLVDRLGGLLKEVDAAIEGRGDRIETGVCRFVG